MSALRVSLVQEPLAWHDPPANRERFSALLTPLAQRTDLIVLPETFTSGFSMEVERLAERAGGPTVTWMQAQAARTDAAITGSVITAEDGKYYNRLLFVLPCGEVRHYDKRHLFRMGREHEHFTPGRSAWSTPWRGLRICPLVCYDLRFPVFSRRARIWTTMCWCTSPTGRRRAPRPGGNCCGHGPSRIRLTWWASTGSGRTAPALPTPVTARPSTSSGGR